MYGAKTLAVREGILDLHGTSGLGVGVGGTKGFRKVVEERTSCGTSNNPPITFSK